MCLRIALSLPASSGLRGRSPVRRPSCAPPPERSASLELLPVAPALAPVRPLSPAALAAAASDDAGARSRSARYHVRRQRDSAQVPPPRRLQVPPCPPSSCSQTRTPRATTCRRGLHRRAPRLPPYLLLRLVLRLVLCVLLRPLPQHLMLRTRTFPSARPASAVTRSPGCARGTHRRCVMPWRRRCLRDLLCAGTRHARK